MIDIEAACIFLAMGLAIFIMTVGARSALVKNRVFHNPSYQLGMVFASANAFFVFGVFGVFLWLVG